MKRGIILFDIDDTLFETTKFSKLAREKSITALQKSLENHGYTYSYDYLYDEFLKVYDLDKNSGKLFDKLLIDVLKVDVFLVQKLVSVCVYEYHRAKHKMEMCEGAKDVLNNLKTDYILGVVSDGRPIKQWDKLIRLGLDNYFDPKLVFITRMFESKKDEIFYEIVKKHCEDYFKLNNLDFNLKNIFVVGDIEFKDIVIPKKIGLSTIRYKSIDREGDFSNSVADYKIESLLELIDIFKVNNNK